MDIVSIISFSMVFLICWIIGLQTFVSMDVELDIYKSAEILTAIFLGIVTLIMGITLWRQFKLQKNDFRTKISIECLNNIDDLSRNFKRKEWDVINKIETFVDTKQTISRFSEDDLSTINSIFWNLERFALRVKLTSFDPTIINDMLGKPICLLCGDKFINHYLEKTISIGYADPKDFTYLQNLAKYIKNVKPN